METIKKIIRTIFIVAAIAGVMVAVGQVDNTENEITIRAIGLAAFVIGSTVASLLSGNKETINP